MPKSKRKWFHPQTHTGWHKDMPVRERRELVYKSEGRNYLTAFHKMDALAKVSQDQITREEARKDADYFLRKHEETGK